MGRYVAGEISFQEQRRERICEVFETKFSDAEADGLFSVYLGHYENSWRAYPDVLPCFGSLRVDHVAVITNGGLSPETLSNLARHRFRRGLLVLADVVDAVKTRATRTVGMARSAKGAQRAGLGTAAAAAREHHHEAYPENQSEFQDRFLPVIGT